MAARSVRGEDVSMEGISRLRRPATQLKQPLTREFVEAGLELIEEALQHDPETEGSHPFLSWISQGKVVAKLDGRAGVEATEGALRDRWEYQSHYVRDLVDHIRMRRSQLSFPVRAAKEIKKALESSSTPSQVVRSISQQLLTSVFDNEYFRLRLVALAALGAPQYREPAEEKSAIALYRDVDKRWEPFFEEYFEKYDLKLRAGIKANDLVQMATAFGEGIALRELAEPTAGAERNDRIRLHANGLLAFVFALTEPKGSKSMSINKAVDGMAPNAAD